MPLPPLGLYLTQVLDEQTVNADWYMKDAKADAIKGRLGGRDDGEFAIRNRCVPNKGTYSLG